MAYPAPAAPRPPEHLFKPYRRYDREDWYRKQILDEFQERAAADQYSPPWDYLVRWRSDELSPHVAALDHWYQQSAAARSHPLYHTHHRKPLLAYWLEHGHGPDVSPTALQHFTDWISKHADALEDDIRDLAEALLRDKPHEMERKLGVFADPFTRKDNPTKPTPRNLRRALRKAFRQFNEQAAHTLQLVGKDKQRYVSDVTRSHRRHQLRQQRKWIEATKATNDSSGESVPLAKCIRTPEARFSELYTLVKGQEEHFTGRGYVALFVTLTSPARYHPNPSHGSNQWDGSTVKDSHEWFTHQWQIVRAALNKAGIRMDGFRVTEPHQDGAEHWHLMCYVKKQQLDIVKRTILGHFGHSPQAVRFKADFSKNVNEKKATAASYMMKYLIKTLSGEATANTEAANDRAFKAEADAADAWRSTWGIRSFQFFGTLFGKQTLWRELRRLKRQPDEPEARTLWRAARGGRAAVFIGCLVVDEPETAAIREVQTEWTDPDPDTGETTPYTKKGRIVGIQINGQQYITKTTKFTLETDLAAMNEDLVTVIHKSPSGTTEQVDRSTKWADPPPSRPPAAA